jgi:hypothetical protein
VKDASELLGYDNDINEIFHVDGTRIAYLLIVQPKVKSYFSI